MDLINNLALGCQEEASPLSLPMFGSLDLLGVHPY
jgi:hypothetical protein